MAFDSKSGIVVTYLLHGIKTCKCDAYMELPVRLTRYTDFAIRVMLYLAAHEGRLCSIGEIAKAHDISQNHLMKVASDLAGSGYVQSLRGRGGGLRLGRPANEINIGQMIRHTEGKVDLVGCGECALAPACGMVCAFRDAVETFFGTLERYSLADIMATGHPDRLRQILAAETQPSGLLQSI
ncbi:MAG TPA: Rrf2 family transcriptional regulator [Acidisoma sp.]|uniref:RrF2 family transcriptional regulator n=1 Tax=Acidisoma sp. TaxID=1872115 RepID=UPI002D040B54|nr:Rrf2 family transcriptional regulator [Acidisoma sp.]HTI00698.1 Rrf2 family transcriptional regulator [Acidisoma sp.]